MTPFVSLWVLFLKAFQSDMKNTAVIQSISLLPDFTQFFFFYLTPSVYFLRCLSSLSVFLTHFPSLSPPVFFFAISFSLFTFTFHSLLPDCRWQPLVLGSQLYQVGCLGRGPQSSSGRAAHPHRSNKHTQVYTQAHEQNPHKNAEDNLP